MREGEFRNDAKETDKSSGMLTVDEVLTTKGFEHLTRKEAEEYIQAMVQFCVIAYTTYSKIEAAKAAEETTDETKAVKEAKVIPINKKAAEEPKVITFRNKAA